MLAQVSDDFSDGDFVASPAWSGDESKFVIYGNQLRLQAPPSTGTASLSTPSQATTNALWEVLVKMDFNPSSGNYTRIYLTSDNNDLSGNLNGYFVLIGDTPDEVSLYKQTGDVRTKIIDGTNDRVNLTAVDVKIKVIRDGQGNWELFSDVGITGNYFSEGTVIDNTHVSSVAFGISCIYTSTRSTQFYFDDITVTGNPFSDIVPPELQSIRIISADEIELIFSEELDEISAITTSNYSVDSEIGNPTEAQLHSDKRTVELRFAKSFPNAISCTLAVEGVKDVAGNLVTPSQRLFVFSEPVQPKWRDIIITEIFPDPSPMVGLPESEFIEIFNRSATPYDLADWAFTDGGSSGNLPSIFLSPGEYLILTTTSAAETLTIFGSTIGLSNFPTLNNSGDALLLKDNNGVVIDSVNYSDGWYHDEDKKSGGYSLELIDPANICSESENWTASENVNGGTPGKQNSVFANKPDLNGPRLLSAIPSSPSLLIVNFSEKLEKEIPGMEAFSVQPIIPVSLVRFSNNSLSALELWFDGELEPGTTYTIQIGAVYDCAGNRVDERFSKIEFGLPGEADSLDVLVNEILFDPRPTGVDFVEIYNNSTDYLNLKNWTLANIEAGVTINSTPVSLTDILLRPGGYLVLTENSNIVKGEYPLSIENNFLNVADMPSMNDDEGTIALVDDRGVRIDWKRYYDDLHSPFIKDDEGVSLERISFTVPTSDDQNWKSASSVIGFATPGYANSAARPETFVREETVMIEPEIFIPVGGLPDFVKITYKFDHGGFVGNVKIVDPQGRAIKELANNELLGTEGFFRWDGDTMEGTKARIGYYMVWFEIFDAAGNVEVIKRRVAIAGRF